MLQTIRSTPKRLFSVARRPYNLVVSMRYRFDSWNEADVLLAEATPAELLAPRAASARDISFTYAVIALSARMARGGGGLTREKYVAFRDAFPLRGGFCAKIRTLFALACQDDTPYEQYVAQILQAFPGREDLFSTLVARLFAVATAGGDLPADQEHALARIAHRLGLSPSAFTDMRERYVHGAKPHQLLGIEKRAPASTIKKRYYALMQRYHPDRFAAERISPELELLLQLKTSEINAAYRQITRRAA